MSLGWCLLSVQCTPISQEREPASLFRHFPSIDVALGMKGWYPGPWLAGPRASARPKARAFTFSLPRTLHPTWNTHPMSHGWSQNKEGAILLRNSSGTCRAAMFSSIWTRDAKKGSFHRKREARSGDKKRERLLRLRQATSQAVAEARWHPWRLATISLFLCLSKGSSFQQAHGSCHRQILSLVITNVYLSASHSSWWSFSQIWLLLHNLIPLYFMSTHSLLCLCVCDRDRERTDIESSDLSIEVFKERHCLRLTCS